ncbi:MAG: Wzz/FepE/Etk N-terminal domain-containing protein [Chloroherpetonaceae bacterium]|nr:Wzz/FepE/Etk N-terminal domain-containing protein [Chloroherpetonaceae bacterium]
MPQEPITKPSPARTEGEVTRHSPDLQNGYEPTPRLVEYLNALYPWRRYIVFGTLFSTLVATVVSFILPEWYKSSATILVPPPSDLLGLTRILGGASGLGSGLSGAAESVLGKKLGDDIDRYEAIFDSRRLRMAVIQKFDLVRQYEYDDPDTKEPIKKTLEELDDNLIFKNNRNNTVTITAYYKGDSVKAAEMVNFVIAMIDSINRELATENARYQRQFIEKRYAEAREALKQAEERLNEFQKTYRVGEVREQVKASLEASAQVEALAVQSEVEYNVLRKSLGDFHPEVLQARDKAQELRRQAKKFEIGGLQSDLIIPLAKMPDLGMEYLRLYREVMLQTKIVEFLLPQYEQAKLQEVRDTPTLLVLDRGYVPEWKARPKRALIIIGGFLGGLLLSISLVLLQYELAKSSNAPWLQALVKMFRLR